MSKKIVNSPVSCSTSRRLYAWLLCSTALTLLLPMPVMANPNDGKVVAGKATIVPQGSSTLTINQTSQKAIINWQSFSIGAGETTNFIQPNATSITLNRVTGVDPSSIMGNLTANGQVWLINPNGIAFGKSGRVDVAGLLATTIDIADKDFMGGTYRFTSLRTPSAMVTNAGQITIRGSGLAALVAPGVENSGVIQANLGQIQLSSTAAFTVDLYGDGLFNFTLDKQVTQTITKSDGTKPTAAVTNTGNLIAPGGRILLTANAARSVVDHSINMSGYAQATSAKVTNGEIVLDGGDEGTVQVAGTLEASGKGTGQTGGTVQVTGSDVNIGQTARIDVSGSAGGGTALIGGDMHGNGILRHAATSTVTTGATINADAVSKGNGGTVVVWSDNQTNYQGTISAHGGATGGNGGSVEVSSHSLLGFNGTVDLRAQFGHIGTLLLDPENVTITATGSAPTLPVSSSGPITLSANADNSTLSVATLQNALSLADVTITTGTTGSQAGDITVAANVSWSGSNSLTLSAYRSININDGATIANTGAGNLNLHADNTGTGVGTVIFNGTGKADWSGSTGNVSIFYNPTVGATTVFTDNFNRADGPVGNGWSDATDTPGSNLFIKDGVLTINQTFNSSGNNATIYRPVDYSKAVTVSADITNQNGYYSTLLGRYVSSFLFGNDGTVAGGYDIMFYRGDNNYANSSVSMSLNGIQLENAASTFQYGAQIHVQATRLPSGIVYGSVSGDVNTFNFEFTTPEASLPGSNFGIYLSSASTVPQTVSNVVITESGIANYSSPTDFSSHVTTNTSVPHQLTAYMLVNNVFDLQNINQNLSGNYALGRDIDASGAASWNAGAGFSPLGNKSTPFTGVFDGLGHSIDKLTINDSSDYYVGLLGYVSGGGDIKNVSLTNESVTATHPTQTAPSGTNWSVGGLVGYSNSPISNSSAQVTMHVSSNDGGANVGGLVGWTYGNIDSSYSTGTIVSSSTTVNNGVNFVGGLAGIGNGSVTNSHSSVDVTTSAYTIAGGLIGADSPTCDYCTGNGISKSYATGAVSAPDGTAGGLVGRYTGHIDQSFALGSVTGGDRAGGLVANLVATQIVGDSITDSYATGSVVVTDPTHQHIAGGLVGLLAYGTISNSYSTGTVTAKPTTYDGTNFVGGFIGCNGSTNASAGTLANSYWDTQTSGQGLALGGGTGGPNGTTGLTTAQFKSGLPAGFDSTVWAINGTTNDGYAFLKWQTASTNGSSPGVTINFGVAAPALTALTWSVANASGTYGTLATLGTVTLTGVSNSDIGFVTSTVGLFSGNTQVSLSPSLAAGTYTEQVVSISGTAASHYTLSATGNTFGTLTIDPAHLTVMANSFSRIYGDANPALTYDITSGKLFNGDTLAGALATSATITSNVNSYAIMQGTLAASSNYDLTFVNGTLTISKAPLSVTVNDANRYAANPNPQFTATITGFKLGQDQSVITGLVLATDATQNSPTGNYSITATGGTSGNYVIVARHNGTLFVTYSQGQKDDGRRIENPGPVSPGPGPISTSGPDSGDTWSPNVPWLPSGMGKEYWDIALHAISADSAIAANLILNNTSLNEAFEEVIQHPGDIPLPVQDRSLAINCTGGDPNCVHLPWIGESPMTLWAHSITNAEYLAGVLTQKQGEALNAISEIAGAADEILKLTQSAKGAAGVFSAADDVFIELKQLSSEQLANVISAIGTYSWDPAGSAQKLTKEISLLGKYEALLSNNSDTTRAFLLMVRDGARDALISSPTGRTLIVEQVVIDAYTAKYPGALRDPQFLSQLIEIPHDAWFGLQKTKFVTIAEAARMGYVSLGPSK